VSVNRISEFHNGISEHFCNILDCRMFLSHLSHYFLRDSFGHSILITIAIRGVLSGALMLYFEILLNKFAGV